MNERVGDLLRAWRVLGVYDDEARRRIAALLGVAWEPPAGDAPTDDTAPDAPDDDLDAWFGEDDTAPRSTPPRAETGPTPPVPTPDEPPQRSRLVSRRHERVDAPSWWDGTTRLPDDVDDLAGLAHAPLLDPRRARALLATSMSSPAPFGDVDVGVVVDTIARGRSLEGVPRRAVPSLAGGCQLLVDRGPGMLPFRDDVAALVDGARAVVGGDRLELRWFDGCPERGVGRFGEDADEPWRPVAPGVSVVCVSDIGIASSPGRFGLASVAAWRFFGRRVARSVGRRPLVWVPFEEARWPAELRDVLSLVTWDRAATTRRLGTLARGIER